ncbi:YqaJ viral recombinase family protein [Rhizobium leguminosarum bv. trifolii WSM597]|uniref:YqaJ viral recombinase family protein n=1 Tax=Rhizobium leguminosarum bv. trifolii WSM597 TaxID=754764 RepID=J0GZA9_RHILT|nr:YqaJ viral recombinase family protein [Rhizobium leguminosarum]EJB02933.1 YqaJ viral recombinase family protein [Rhizobium leguminosarum bv. trifolii WSM597]
MSVECILPGDRADWLELRRGFVTASVAGALLQCHPYTTAYQLWALKSGRLEESTEENEAMRRGRLLEPVAVQMLREERPTWTIDYRADNAFYLDRGLKLGATPDSFAYRPDISGRGIVQFKTSSEEAFRDNWIDPESREVEVPLWIAVQAIVEAKLTGAAWAAVAVLVVGRGIKMEVIDIPLHAQVWEALLGAASEFWRITQVGEHPPVDWDRDGSTVLDVNRWTEAKRIDLTADETVDLFASNLEDTRTKRRELQKREDVLRAQILYALGSAEVATTRRFEILAPTVVRADGAAQRAIRIKLKDQSNGRF